MDEFDEILENIRANEEIARKLFEIELKILSIDNFRDLFEELLFLIEEKFQIPHVWISIVENSDLSNLLEVLESSHLLRKRLNMVPKRVLIGLLGNRLSPLLANQDLTRFYRLLPQAQKYLIRSLTVCPITLEGDIVGSLNLGDSSETRFQPDMDTFFLSQLVVKISLCLSNVIAREKLRYLAIRDPLTDLLNRREMGVVLEQEFNRALRYGNSLAMLFIDCDDFKSVNDNHGHNCGDVLLRHIARQLREVIRTSDMIFRFAGDEFVIILPNQTSQEAEKMSVRLREFFRAHPMEFEDTLIPISISCGFASIEEDGVTDPASMLKMADKRLYDAKERKSRNMGKGRPPAGQM